MSKDYNLTLRAANTLLKEMDAQGLFAKQAQGPLAESTSQPQPADEDFTLGEDAQPREEAPILGAEAQPIKDEPFTLGDEKKQPTRREFPHVSQPIKSLSE